VVSRPKAAQRRLPRSHYFVGLNGKKIYDPREAALAAYAEGMLEGARLTIKREFESRSTS
jgi:hypothetical protein